MQKINSINQNVNSRKSKTVIQPVVETKVKTGINLFQYLSSNNFNVSTVSKSKFDYQPKLPK